MDLDVPKAHPACQIIPEEEKLDYRRRRRNRMRASCLSCYASKRKCDKKRPCGRCVRLGTTGLCKYEIEDAGDGLMNISERDEAERLRQRIAELESVIRELKKNPHPRWTTPGGIMHDPNFFDSFRGSTSQAMEDVPDDAVSTEVKVKAEDIVLCRPELIATAHGILHDSSPAHPPHLFVPEESLSGDSEVTVSVTGITPTNTSSFPTHDIQDGLFHNVNYPDLGFKSIPIMRQAVTLMKADNPFTMTDSSGESLSATFCPQASHGVPTFDHGFQTVVSVPLSQTNDPQPSPNNPDPCNCLIAPMAFGPLLHLSISLRTSREALEHLHPLSSDCMLYDLIKTLEGHIFSVPPNEKTTKLKPSPGPCMSSYSSRAYKTMLSQSSSNEALEYLFQYPLSNSYPPTLQSHLTTRSPEPFAYMSDTSVPRSTS